MIPALCELEAGIQQVVDPVTYRSNLKQLLRQVRIWPIDLETARLYGEIHFDLRRRGRVLSEVDIMLAAMARQMNLTLATTDKDFTALPDIPTENWLVSP
jgi:tRNA(fMet)-specific endonuclease VapC